MIEFKLGDIQPGQPVKISFQMIGLLEVVNGHFRHSLPEAFYPDYSKHGLSQEEAREYKYKFKYNLHLKSQQAIAYASVPRNSEIIKQDNAKKNIQIQLL